MYSTVEIGNWNTVEMHHIITLQATTVDHTAVKTVSLVAVAYTVELTRNLLSASCIRKKRWDEKFKTDNDNSEIRLVEVIYKENRDQL